MIFRALLRLVMLATLGAALAWAAFEGRDRLERDWQPIVWVLAFFAAACALELCILTLKLIPQVIVHWWVMRPSRRSGSAGWCTPAQMRKARLHQPRNGLLLGLNDRGRPIFANVESSGLILAPAGGGKTVSFVIPTLCHSAESMFVPDLKGILACMTAHVRRKRFGHRILIINPAGRYAELLGPAARYNPLQILIDAWNDPAWHNQVMADARAIAHQLCQDPPQEGENQYFRNGSRKFLVFAFVYLVTIENRPLLSEALRLISDTERFTSCLWVAMESDVLSGDLARLAKDLITKLEAKDVKQIESFREGAVQALEVFSPSGSLAACTAASDFRFADLKTEAMTVYVLADPTRMSVFMPWLGLLSWCAMTELIRSPAKRPVTFLLDEVTNFKIRGLPQLLTLAREFKIRMWLVIQELAEWGNTYGRESIETVLSQTEIKLFMANTSHRTCQLISDMLGEATIKSRSHGLGRSLFDLINTSVQDSPRRLMTPDEIRRSEHSIAFIKNLRPIRLRQIGYHEVRPWSRWVGINPLFGTRLKGKNKLSL